MCIRDRRKGAGIANLQNRIETVGPIQGFSLDYVIEARVDQARGQVLIRSREWVVRPMQEFLGETPEEALRPRPLYTLYAGHEKRRGRGGRPPERTKKNKMQ